MAQSIPSAASARRPAGKRRAAITSAPRHPTFPIIGIGASAGGLEALEQFLAHVAKPCGMAFVVVQHLDPTRKGLMVELLQRRTELTVVQVRNGISVQPEHVYVIPPDKDLSLLHGVLHLLPPARSGGLRLPIDTFFRSLAQDQQEKSVGVILSGMGSDGTLGLRAIKEQAGLVLVQDPSTARFDSMPRSVIDAGLADLIAPPAEMPGRILAFIQRHPMMSRIGAESERNGRSHGELGRIIVLLRAHSGNDFSYYKRNTLCRRIERRMDIHHIKKMSDYATFLQDNPQETGLLFKELLIGVTSFFRDPDAWKALRTVVASMLAAKREPGQVLRAWVPGCSSGEEAYSLAILLAEAIADRKPRSHARAQIFATDLDRDAIDKARLGVYPENLSTEISPERLKRFFTKTESGFRVRKEIREMVIFAPQNLIADPPFTRLDLISCRNLLIYLNAEVQKKVIPLFHYSLLPDGILFQGSAETLGDHTDLFAQISRKHRIFRKTDSVVRIEQVAFPSNFSGTPQTVPEARTAMRSPASLQSLADQLVLRQFAHPTVLTNDKGDIFYVSGRTGAYLEPAAGKANWNIFAMAREGLRYPLVHAFPEVLRSREPVCLRGLKVGSNLATQVVDVSLQRLHEPGPLLGLVVVAFCETSPASPRTIGSQHDAPVRGAHDRDLERELMQFQAEAQATQEEMQTSQEELRSANEELQSTNEELQSTNEELTTSKEEVQSMNEELQTVNAELVTKVEDLSRASNDMKNLLDSTDIATLFLDKGLLIRRFTPQMTKIIKLIAADIGRPITDLASAIRYPHLARDARLVLKRLTSLDRTIGTRAGRCYSVRIMPYRTYDDRIDGVVITFIHATPSVEPTAKPGTRATPLQRRRPARPARGR
ncbi:MAG TPA: chemotaxis protein CheB [Planctomycetes bacterium]|nr:chemotaxis protein CheB [Planctomycetota bacterium]